MTKVLREFMQSVHKNAWWITLVDKKVIHRWTKKLSTEVIHMSFLVPGRPSPTFARTCFMSCGAYIRVGKLQAASCGRAASCELHSRGHSSKLHLYARDSKLHFVDFELHRPRSCKGYEIEEEAKPSCAL